MTREEFWARLAPIAIRARREGSSMFPSVRLAQNLLETGGVIHSWNNLGGIKVGSGGRNAYWRGRTVNKDTWEVYNGQRVNVSSDFRAYDSIYDYYKDQDLLFQLPRYAAVREADTPEQQARALQSSGYATDPQYASKLISIMNTHGLKRYDQQAAAAPAEAVPVAIRVNGQSIGSGYAVDGITWAPARALGNLLGATVGWNGTEVTINGTPRATLVIGGSGYVPLRELAESLGARVTWDAASNTVTIVK